MLASTSRALVRYVKEAEFGVIPATAPKNLRFTGEGLEFGITTDTSKEIRSDRQTTDLVQTGASSSGNINFELSYLEFDDLIEAALMGTWSVYGTNGVSGSMDSVVVAADSITAGTAPTGNDAFTKLVKGQWFKFNADGSDNDGKYFQVSEDTAPTATVITLSAATPATAEANVDGVTLSSSRLTNGTTERSFSIEKAFSDINQFFAYRGMEASKMSLSFESANILTGSFDFMGKDAVRGSATNLTGTPADSQTYDVMNAVSGVGNIMEGGAVLNGTFIKSLSLSLDNKLRARDAIGTLGAISIGSGTIDMTGSMDVYLADGTLYDKFLNNTASSISLRAVDGAGNGYIFTIPKIKYSDAKVVAGAMDQDAMITLPFTGLRDPDTGNTILIDRVGVAAA